MSDYTALEQHITADELKIWQWKYTNFFYMSAVHISVPLKPLWEYNCSHISDKIANAPRKKKRPTNQQCFMPLKFHHQDSACLWDSRTHHFMLPLFPLLNPIHRVARSKFLIFGAAFIVYLHYNLWVKKETSKKVGDHAVKSSSQLFHSLHDEMQFTTLKNVAWCFWMM